MKALFFIMTDNLLLQFCHSFRKWYLYSILVPGFKYRSKIVKVKVYGLDDWGSRVRFPAGAGNFSLHHSVQNGSGAHSVSYPMGTRGSFLGGKAAGA
jgi:hypothetical protein